MSKMESCVKRLLRFALVKLSKNNIIIECNPFLSDNTSPVLDLILDSGWNKRYKIILVSLHPEKNKKYYHFDNLVCLTRKKLLHRILIYAYACRAKAIIDYSTQIAKVDPATFHFYLAHGSPMKSVKNYYNCDPTTDFMLSQSPFWSKINAIEFKIAEEKQVVLGYPRNDELLQGKQLVNLKALFGDRFDKFVVWYPTYRQNRLNLKHSSISIPIIHDEKTAIKINQIAQKYKTAIIIKPHHAQDMRFIKVLNLSNIIFIDDDFFFANNLKPYAFLGATDALITDYSSVYFDYLLLEKPIALTFEDYEEYSRTPGFAIDTDQLEECSHMLFSADDFESFVQNIYDGIDLNQTKRAQLKAKLHYYMDSCSSQRVFEFIQSSIEEHI